MTPENTGDAKAPENATTGASKPTANKEPSSSTKQASARAGRDTSTKRAGQRPVGREKEQGDVARREGARPVGKMAQHEQRLSQDRQERLARNAHRPDPSDEMKERNARLHEQDPNKYPPVQHGLSSSELNTSHPDQKEAKAEEVADMPHNNMGGEGTQEEHDADAKLASN